MVDEFGAGDLGGLSTERQRDMTHGFYYYGRKNYSGLIIFEKRKKLRWTREYLATQIQLLGYDMSGNMLSKIELGYRPIYDYELLYISKALGLPITQLLPDCIV